MTVGIGSRNLQAAISQRECSIDMKGRALSAGRSEVRVGGPGVLGAVEVLCVQRKVLVREPLRSLGKLWNPFECGDRDHAICSFAISVA